MAPTRPAVSLIVPVAGDPAALASLLSALARVRRGPRDEIIVADNRPMPEPAPPVTVPASGIRLHPAGGLASPGFARNRGAAAAANPWLVFVDADTAPAPDLLDAYFDPPPAAGTGVLAGGIRDVLAPGPGRDSAVARHLVAREQMSQANTLSRGRPYAQSANLAVRRCAFVAVGGFAEHVRAGVDADLCLRLAAAGWELESRPAARVDHRARTELAAVLLQLVGHGSGAAWCERRHPGAFPPAGPVALSRRLASHLAAAALAGLRGDGPRVRSAGLELLEALAFAAGRVLPNRARRRLRA